MRFLLTNDDGITAEGIEQLRIQLIKIGEVTVVAPDRQRSGTGHSITVDRPLRVQRIEYANNHCVGWSVDGTPVDCVKLGLERLLDYVPDMVISGINLGANLGTDVLYSGTVSAAYEGIINNIPSIAVSLNSGNHDLLAAVASDICRSVEDIAKLKLPDDVLLNINYPDVCKPKGIKVTRLGTRRYINVFEKRLDPRGRSYYWLAGDPVDQEGIDLNIDVVASRQGYISVTPLQSDVTNYSCLEVLRGLEDIKFD